MAPPNRICSDKIIRDGDLVFIDIGAAWNGYFGDMARTVYCGTQASSPSKEQINVYSAVYYGLQAGINEMRPGKTNKDSANALINEASKFGLGGRFLSLFIGHGVGIGANEPPYIGETLPGAPEYEFEPGMVFAVDGGASANNFRSQVGDSFIITKDGYEQITHHSKNIDDLIIPHG
jgi:Xaa-Pro aminopeptidase